VTEPVGEPNANLRRLRMERSLTQEQVAAAAKIQQSHYSLIERGMISPTMRTARKIARVLDVDLDAVWPDS
jgi:transcriptional regulator with XRE-family HTH domain